MLHPPHEEKAMKTPTTTPDVHEAVRHAYTQALDRAEAGRAGCCSAPTGRAAAGGVAATLAGYAAAPAAYQDAAASSFGCGNPLAFAGVEPGQTVLDLGSGAGYDLLLAADRVGATGKVIGIDMTDAMIEAARRNAARAGHDHVEVRKGLIEALPVADASVDWVISNCVINLSPDKPRVFAEIARVLRPGGRFAISDIVVDELPAWIRGHAAAYAACVAGAISETEYLAGLRAAGLVDVTVTERQVYDADQLRALVASDLESFGLDPTLLDRGLGEVVGKVWSARLTGRRQV
jgi:SAM-dependent methyltransferase